MVVIKDKIESLDENIGKKYVSRLESFATVIGYSLENDGNEIKIEFNPDRPDLFSFYALRESMKTFYDQNYKIKSPISKNEIKLEVDKKAAEERPFVLSFTAEGVPLGKYYNHIINYQERLHDTIGKSRKKVAIGIHDLDNIKPPFKLSMEKKDKLFFTTYDNFAGTAGEIMNKHPKGIEFHNLIKSEKYVPVIKDMEGDVMSLPPVINGIKSRISESTSRLFFDITGSDYNAVRSAFYLFAYEMTYLGYHVSSGINERDIIQYDFREMKLKDIEISNLIGVKNIEPVTLLRKMGYRCEVMQGGYKIKVPGNRVDVMGPVDLIEDIAKSFGYDNIPEIPLKTENTGKPFKFYDDVGIINDILISINYQEAKTFVLNSSEYYNGLKYTGGVKIENPKSQDYSVIRDNLYPGLLNFLRINKRRGMPVKIFETGDVIKNGKQESHLCVIYSNSRASYADIFGVLQYFLQRTIDIKPVIKPYNFREIIEGRGGEITIDSNKCGIIGELNPALLEKFDLQNPLVFFEVNLDFILDNIK